MTKTSAFRAASVSSVFGTLTTAFAIFAIFRIGVEEVGLTAVGAWALLQGLFLVARVADSGVGINITRRVALVSRDSDPGNRVFAAVGLISGTAPVALVTALSYPVVVWYVSSSYQDQIGGSRIQILAVCCCVFGIFTSAANSLLAVCEGRKKIVLKNGVVVASNVAGILVAYPAMHFSGAPGIGYTYSTIAVTQFVVACAWLISSRDSKSRADPGVVRSILRDTVRENLQLLAMAATRLSFEPITKFFVSLVAPLAYVAILDLAIKVAGQVRGLMQAAAQPLVAFSATSSNGSTAPSPYYSRADALMAAVVCLVLDAVILASPLISWVALGALSVDLVVLLAVLFVGNLINARGLIGYFYLIGRGGFTTLLLIQVGMALANLLFAAVGLATSERLVVVIGLSATYAIGGFLLARAYDRDFVHVWNTASVGALLVRAVLLVIYAGGVTIYGTEVMFSSWIGVGAGLSAGLLLSYDSIFLLRVLFSRRSARGM